MRKYRIVERYLPDHDCFRFVIQKKVFLFWMDIGRYCHANIDDARSAIERDERKSRRSNKKDVVVEELEFD